MVKLFVTCYGLWCSLGIYRGFQDYNNKFHKDYIENPNSKKPEYYYSDLFASSALGFIAYANPLTLPVFAFLEIRELELKIRSIKKD
jgi:hypothetical protein